MKTILVICTAIVFLGLYFQIWFPDRAFATNRPSVVDDKDTTNTKAIQTRWLTDHSGCMRMRSLEDGYVLIDKFHLKGALQDKVLKVLGEPNRIIIDSAYVNDVNGKYIRMLYYCYSRCGVPSEGAEFVVKPESWLTITLSYKNLSYTKNRVVEIMGAEE